MIPSLKQDIRKPRRSISASSALQNSVLGLDSLSSTSPRETRFPEYQSILTSLRALLEPIRKGKQGLRKPHIFQSLLTGCSRWVIPVNGFQKDPSWFWSIGSASSNPLRWLAFPYKKQLKHRWQRLIQPCFSSDTPDSRHGLPEPINL